MGKIHHKPIPGFPGQHTRGHKYYAQLKTQPATYMVKGCCISTAPDAGLDKVDIPWRRACLASGWSRSPRAIAFKAWVHEYL